MPRNTASSSPLGLAVALPPGTSSQMKSRRAEALRRREHHLTELQRQNDDHEQSKKTTSPPKQPSPPPSSSNPRRLAPQRKKASVADMKTSSPPPPGPTSGLPINISSGKERDGSDDVVVERFEDERSLGKDGVNDLAKNVADWTLRGGDRDAKGSRPMVTSKTEDDDDSVEKEYHGEIESAASSDNDQDTGDNYDEEGGEGFIITVEEEVSLNPPPPTSPLVLVDLEALSGCRPEDEEEKEILTTQLMEALLGSPKKEEREVGDDEKEAEEQRGNGSGGGGGNSLGDGLSLDFDERVVELFECGVAHHADSSDPTVVSCLAEGNEEGGGSAGSSAVTPYVAVAYPEFLSSGPQKPMRSTLRMWKLLHTAPAIADDDSYSALVSRVFGHLRDTSRSLIWRADMHYELSLIVRREHMAKVKRAQRREYDKWKDGVRRERLDKLYEVRETFTLQVGVAEKKHAAFVEEREGRVDRELRRRGLHRLRGSTLREGETLVVDGRSQNDEYDNGDGWGDATVREEDIVGEDNQYYDGTAVQDHSPEEEEEGDNDEWAPLEIKGDPLGMNIVLDGVQRSAEKGQDTSSEEQCKTRTKIVITNKLEPISQDDNLKRKSKRLQKKKDILASAPTKQRDDYFKSQRESIREMLKSNDERIAEATLLKLRERLQNVDDLLESLQEEEWAEEDEEEEEGDGGAGVEYDREEELANGSTLLDQILAMILGGLPPPEGSAHVAVDTTAEETEHYRYVRGEHKAIVDEWIKAFGRLPPFPSDEEAETQVDPGGDGDDVAMPFGDAFSPPDSKNFLPIDNGEIRHRDDGGGKNIDLTLVDNNDSNWDEVEDWDALFP